MEKFTLFQWLQVGFVFSIGGYTAYLIVNELIKVASIILFD
jgi:hypothetical protein